MSGPRRQGDGLRRRDPVHPDPESTLAGRCGITAMTAAPPDVAASGSSPRRDVGRPEEQSARSTINVVANDEAAAPAAVPVAIAILQVLDSLSVASADDIETGPYMNALNEACAIGSYRHRCH